MKKYPVLLTLLTLVLFNACSEKNIEAETYMQNIEDIYKSGDYIATKQKIDSIQILYPKAFEQIKQGIALLQEVRKAENTEQIRQCDSLLNLVSHRIDSIKQHFVFEKDKKYDDTGRYLPKVTAKSTLTGTYLRSGVSEDGQLYIESVYLGEGKHNTLKVSVGNSGFAETLPVTGEGLNYRFSDLGKQYEIIKYTKGDEADVPKFIFAFADKSITATLKGKGSISFVLPNTTKKSIADSYQLAVWMEKADSLQSAKGKAETLLHYLNNKNTIKEEK